jgi:hypothetical protein
MPLLLAREDVQRLSDASDVSSFYMFIFKMLPCPKVRRSDGSYALPSSCCGTLLLAAAITDTKLYVDLMNGIKYRLKAFAALTGFQIRSSFQQQPRNGGYQKCEQSPPRQTQCHERQTMCGGFYCVIHRLNRTPGRHAPSAIPMRRLAGETFGSSVTPHRCARTRVWTASVLEATPARCLIT